MMTEKREYRVDWVGDGHDPEPLLKAVEVGKLLNLPKKSVYDLPIPQIRLGPRRIRWLLSDVETYVEHRREEP